MALAVDEFEESRVFGVGKTGDGPPATAVTPIHRLTSYVRTESGSAVLLVVVSVIALVWANSPVSASYVDLWHTPMSVRVGDYGIDMDLHHWVNDGLMVAFFFLIGLEVRQELAVGSLRDRSRALVPLVAGVLGVALPALIYLAIAGREAPQGWGVVVGTDTAFLLGVLAMVGPAMSNQLRVFLLTLTVVDDFLAVSIIGVVYTDDLRWGPLVIALLALVCLWLLSRTAEWRSAPYVGIVIVLWIATLESGIHPSLAGMAAGLLVPAFATERYEVENAKRLFRDYWQSPQAAVARTARRGLARSISVNERLHDVLRSPVSLFVVPVFALANAGIDLRGGVLSASLTSTITWGVVLGLVIGKLVGIALGTWAAIRLGLGRLPDGVGRGSVLGGAALSGIGFTVSLLIVGLAFTDTRQAGMATVGVLVAMVLAGSLGWLIFTRARVRWGETSADLPTILEPPVNLDLDHVRGPAEAALTVVEYMDFECPFCAKSTGMWTDVHGHFGDRVRYVVRHLPLHDYHPHAHTAALAAEAAAEQGRFWEMHDLLFAHQHALELTDLVGYADDLGLDVEQFIVDVDSPEVAERVGRHEASAVASGAVGTPTFFLNGTRHRGPHDARTLIAALEEIETEMSAARRRS
ncbi:Na+/H+ antiporter NhaA [Gordonia soli]|uniref:Na(+)/H(+) antiporter NhaA n=1 Tax=Gordonia soli NBRC 108243 TaxID=1223545 RepID=M0QPP7_9ACTN|nr:Na+/H+ antiporter NhaA [Gordonia soli]GAC70246.1 Na(+)/H(+) antiporter NhaA [Gordonia soli NBRC 108243]